MVRRWPLRRRLIALVIVLMAVVATVIGGVSTFALRSSLVGQLDTELMASSRRAGTVPSVPGAFSDGDEAPGLRIPGQGVGTVVLVYGGSQPLGSRITATGAFEQLNQDQADVLMAVPSDGRIHTAVLTGLGRYRVVATVDADGRVWVTGLSTEAVDATITQHVLTTLLVTLAGLVLVGIVGTALVRRELRQLDRVAATATRVAQLPLHSGEVALPDRVPDADTDQRTEVGKVGAALNQLLGHVEAALGSRQASEVKLRRFVADASHELRTPLASIRGYAELARRIPEEVPPDIVRALGRVESEAVRMTQLVEDLLLLARLDAGRDLDRSPVDLTALAADAVADAHAAGPDHVWRLELPGQGAGECDEEGCSNPSCAEQACDEQACDEQACDEQACDGQGYDEHPHAVLLTGDEHSVRQVLANLLANARLHTPAGTVVTTTVETRDDGVVLTVQDTGPGIEPELLARLFDRFSRGDAARSPGAGSTGLGLSIANAVVRAHGGRIDVDGTPGATTFTVTFPLPAAVAVAVDTPTPVPPAPPTRTPPPVPPAPPTPVPPPPPPRPGRT